MTNAVGDHPSGGRLPGLGWLRDQLVRQIEADETCVCGKPKQSQLAPLAARLVVVLEQIEAIEKSKPRGSKVDELSNRRKARRADAPGAGVAAGDRVDGRAGRS